MDLSVYKTGFAWSTQPLIIDPFDEESIISAMDAGRKFDLPALLRPAQSYLFAVEQRIVVPDNLMGLICLRSTLARLSLTAPPTIADPGFRGFLTMELTNASPNYIRIHPSMFLWDMVMVPSLESVYTGRYQDQGPGVAPPKALDWEREQAKHQAILDASSLPNDPEQTNEVPS